MSPYFITIRHKYLKTNMEDGLVKRQCKDFWTLAIVMLAWLHISYGAFIFAHNMLNEWNDRYFCKCRKDFVAYANVCFREFGDRVQHWTTFNEPNVFVLFGYDSGLLPPNRCSSPFGTNCTRGNSSTEPYTAAHNILMAHASTAKLYMKKYKVTRHDFTIWYSIMKAP